MFRHVSHVQGAYSGARSGMTPSLRAGAPGIPPCSGGCLSSAQVLPFGPVLLPPQARRGSHFRAYRARAHLPGAPVGAGAVRADLIARASSGGRTSPVRSRRGFLRPQPLSCAEKRKGGPGSRLSVLITGGVQPRLPHFPPSQAPGPEIVAVRIDRAGLPAYVGHPAARWESGYPSDCKSAYTGSNPVRASKTINDLGKVG